MRPAKSADDWFAEYGVCHQNRTNKIIHWICVPLIMLSLLGLIWEIPVPESIHNLLPWFNWAILFVVICLIFYLALSFSLALGMAAISASCLFLIREYTALQLTDLWVASLTIFVIAWIGQLIGHRIEGKKPAFLDDLKFLLIGPIWLLGMLYRKLGIPY